MKLTRRQKGGIFAGLLTLVGITLGLHKAVKAAPAWYSLLGGTWDADMPFAAYSEHYFDISFKNVSSIAYTYKACLSFGTSGSSCKSGTVPPGGGVGLKSNWYMPMYAGIYSLTFTITIDGVLIDDFVVSEVQVA